MALAHRCSDGVQSKLVRTGPIGTVDGVIFTCPRCGHSRNGTAILADFSALRPAIERALSRKP